MILFSLVTVSLLCSLWFQLYDMKETLIILSLNIAVKIISDIMLIVFILETRSGNDCKYSNYIQRKKYLSYLRALPIILHTVFFYPCSKRFLPSMHPFCHPYFIFNHPFRPYFTTSRPISTLLHSGTSSTSLVILSLPPCIKFTK